MVFRNVRRVIAALGMVTTATAQNFNPIAGFTPRTNVTDKLVKDLIQEELQDLMADEECSSLALAESYYRTGAGVYLQSIPTYGNGPGDTIAEEYEEYRKYYKNDEFHLEWVNKAFKGEVARLQNFNADFAFFPNDTSGSGECVGREESVKKATAYVFTLIESIQLMQKAVDLVEDGCIAQYNNTCEDATNAWDAAAATYVGSLEGEQGKGDGYFLFALADEKCRDFGNCGPTTSRVNALILSLFSAGSHSSYSGDSRSMSRYKRLISNKMAIPLIQGLFRSALRLHLDKSLRDEDVAEAATYAFGLLPKISACSTKAAQKIANELRIGGDVAGIKTIQFSNIRLGIECNYKCLGISCKEVDGMFYDDDKWIRFRECNDYDNGSTRCGIVSEERERQCADFTGDPGIKGRDTFVKLDEEYCLLENQDFIF